LVRYITLNFSSLPESKAHLANDDSRQEHYNWRTRENTLNSTAPQFRTAISLPDTPHPVRIHFLHIKSPHSHAIPLLFLPSFPIPNLSPLLAPLYKPLTEPDDSLSQPFHLIVPSLPGLGFSDALKSDEKLLEQTAEIFDILMRRLGYEFYLTSSTGSGRASPAGIDYHLARLMGEKHSSSCLGTHLLEPRVDKPKLGSWAWTKFTVAKFFHASLFGYTASDFHALRESETTVARQETSGERLPLLANRKSIGFGVVGTLGLREPNTISYALCDSPVGLLSLVCSALRRASPQHTLNSEEIIDITQMAWLPGPEAGLRFWSCAVEEVKNLKLERRPKKKAKVAVTVFDDGDGDGYVCPAWVGQKFDVLATQRVEGKPGLLSYERSDVIVTGVRNLATAVQAIDGRLNLADLDKVVVGNGSQTPIRTAVAGEESFVEWEEDSPNTVVAISR